MEDETERLEAGTGKSAAEPLASADSGGIIQTQATEEDVVRGEEVDLQTEEDDEEPFYGSDDYDEGGVGDSEFEEDEEEPSESAGEIDEVSALVASARDFLRFIAHPARPRFDSAGPTAGFMRVTTTAAEEANLNSGGGGGSESEIVVHYRYTCFTRASPNTWRGHVSVHGSPMLRRVRFLLPSPSLAADPATSLRLVGAALAAMIYPVQLLDQLDALWLGLLAAAPVTVPPGTTRVDVTVDVGVLSPGHSTPERVAYMLKALPSLARQADGWWPAAVHDVEVEVAAVALHLPAPVVRCDDGVQPAKRTRRLAATEDECAICFEVMGRGLAAWPRCAHIFHGYCLEKLLIRGDQRCPLCRTEL